MELSEFRDRLLDSIRLKSAEEGTADAEAFLSYVSDALAETKEPANDILYLPFEGIGSSQRKIQISGFSYNEADFCLSLYIVAPLTYGDLSSMSAESADLYLKSARAFIQDASVIIRSAEESAPAYGLALDLEGKYGNAKKYCICLITDRSVSRQARPSSLSPVNGIKVETRIIDIKYLHRIEEAKAREKDLVIDLLEYTDRGMPCLPSCPTDAYTAYLCSIPGLVLAQLYNTYGEKLLDGNVRSYLQAQGKVNKGIRHTIQNEPEMFFAYNNGIAATAYSLRTRSSRGSLYITEITALQIVNGGQTTASLADFLLNGKKERSEECMKQIFVPMKLSVIAPEKAQRLVPNISHYANSQNKISESDLWSNHPFHIRMEAISRSLLAPAVGGNQYGTHWYYERTAGQYRQQTYKMTESEKHPFEMQNPRTQLFTKTDLAKYINIKSCLPHIVSAGSQMSFTRFSEALTVQWTKDDSQFNEKYFRETVAMAILFRQTDRLVKAQPWFNSYKANIVAYTLSKILYTVSTQYPDKRIDYRSIWLKQGLSDAWVHQIESTSKTIYDMLTDPARPVESVTDWAKREACWEQAKQIPLRLMYAFARELTGKEAEQPDAKEE